MNQGRIWCVVNPTVGLPLFLGAVTVISLTVHYSVLQRTTWMAGFFQGGAKAKAADLGNVSPVAAASVNVTPSFAVSVSQVPASDGGTPSFVVTVTPRTDNAKEAAAADSPPRNAVLADSGTPLR
jgi:light-harvesting protein B-800-850 alpha chain